MCISSLEWRNLDSILFNSSLSLIPPDFLLHCYKHSTLFTWLKLTRDKSEARAAWTRTDRRDRGGLLEDDKEGEAWICCRGQEATNKLIQKRMVWSEQQETGKC